ncbi:hypothetical protein NE237_024550 [Protea cynaroides]|uniref:Uncharacterized protein n=1 Tax=Protea cynaroides TaxID=273540 RepID=A0A9Q0JYN5_9MAGN|nr:hypothetical protein NE237_024550 [Protea cynaroides]
MPQALTAQYHLESQDQAWFPDTNESEDISDNTSQGSQCLQPSNSSSEPTCSATNLDSDSILKSSSMVDNSGFSSKPIPDSTVENIIISEPHLPSSLSETITTLGIPSPLNTIPIHASLSRPIQSIPTTDPISSGNGPILVVGSELLQQSKPVQKVQLFQKSEPAQKLGPFGKSGPVQLLDLVKMSLLQMVYLVLIGDISLPTEPIIAEPIVTTSHPMVTRGRLGIIKPEPKYALTASTIPQEPTSEVEALSHSGWKDEMDNETWVIVPCTSDMNVVLVRLPGRPPTVVTHHHLSSWSHLMLPWPFPLIFTLQINPSLVLGILCLKIDHENEKPVTTPSSLPEKMENGVDSLLIYLLLLNLWVDEIFVVLVSNLVYVLTLDIV